MVATRTVWCTDIDGVLIDSKELVQQAYRDVGIEMPFEAWGHPWGQWLPAFVESYDDAKVIHEKKTKAYVNLLKGGAVAANALPFSQIVRALERDTMSDVYYVTGAAQDAALTILDELGLNTGKLVASSIGTNPRGAVLKSLSPYGIYVDDRIEGQSPAIEAGWKFIWAKQDWNTHWNR